ncbi:MAG: dihydrofolate reductase family protein, partial [Eubacteriaceae bacterium]|nr:dihydrofolate reductase family protein [Eubacteriaceae bacterium]
DICRSIIDEKQKDGKDIYLFGGGILVDNFIKSDMIDEYIIGIVPTILGTGKPLFLGNNPTIKFNLDSYTLDSGIMVLHYSKRANGKTI